MSGVPESGVPETGATRRPSPWIWIAAALSAVLIHAGALAALLAERPAEATDETGAPALEIGIELASPVIEQTDLPPGPEAEAAAASPAVVEQRKSVEETQLPQAVPTETDDPDRVVALAPSEKPKEDEPVKTEVPTAPSLESVAAEATAPAVIEKVREAPTTIAPVVGNGQSTARVRAEWQKRLVAHLDRNKRYPGGAAQHASQVMLTFTLDRTGRVLGASVLKGSGEAAFDDAALAMMRRADPVPAPPPLIADDGLTFTVPVVFRTKGRG